MERPDPSEKACTLSLFEFCRRQLQSVGTTAVVEVAADQNSRPIIMMGATDLIEMAETARRHSTRHAASLRRSLQLPLTMAMGTAHASVSTPRPLTAVLHPSSSSRSESHPAELASSHGDEPHEAVVFLQMSSPTWESRLSSPPAVDPHADGSPQREQRSVVLMAESHHPLHTTTTTTTDGSYSLLTLAEEEELRQRSLLSDMQRSQRKSLRERESVARAAVTQRPQASEAPALRERQVFRESLAIVRRAQSSTSSQQE